MAEKPVNEKKTLDKRVVRTKKAIRIAFSELISEKDLNDITVKDLADRANINRKTFYNYYSGIYQVVEELERDVVNNFGLVFEGVNIKDALTDPRLIFGRIDAMILNDPDFFRNLFTADENFDLTTKMTSMIKEKTKRSICAELSLPEDKANVALEFMISGMVSVYQLWFRQGQSVPLSQASDIVGTLCFSGLNGLLKH